MIISIIGSWKNIEAEHAKFLESVLSDFYTKQEKGKIALPLAYDFLKIVHGDIISNEHNRILNSIQLYKRSVADNAHIPKYEESLRNEVKKVLNYNKFVRKSGAYNAYSLCGASTARTCPYCNHAFSFTFIKRGKGMRPTLDHYYDKDSYPHLALTLYNLIPSCYSCNSNLKGRKDFSENKHLHPLFDSEVISFSLRNEKDIVIDTLEMIDQSRSKIKIELKADNQEAKSSIKTFLLSERYANFVDAAINFSRAKYYFDELKNNNQLDIIDDIKEEVVLRFDKTDYQNELLGRLFFDMYNQFNLMK